MYIQCLDYTKNLNGRSVLNNVSLEIKPGECVGIWGRNASGKTMLLRAFSGLILPDSGSISVAGQLLTPRDRFPRSLGIIIENIAFWPFLTGKDTLRTIASVKKIANAQRICETMELVGLDPDDSRTIRKYSLGMIQKLAIAQAIMEQPSLLLLDEPTNALDEKSRKNFFEIIRSEQARGTTIVISSHTKSDLEISCNRIINIDNGAV